MTGRIWAALAIAAIATAAPARAEDAADPWWSPETVETYGFVELEGTGFFQSARFPGQTRDDISFAARPSLLLEWDGGDVAFTLSPFVRLDAADERRTHFDLREAKIDVSRGDLSFTVGADFVYWGKTEAFQLVDIINSDDLVEDIDGEDKLGQPMVRVTYFTTDYGAFSAFWLPVFREPTIPGEGGRLRPGVPIVDDEARYQVDGDEFAQSFALRWEQVIGDFDFGLSAFHGVSRDAAFEPLSFDAAGRPRTLRPVYDDITQLGFDGQYTTGPTLWKLEAIARFNQLDANLDNTDYVGVTGGLEYTFFAIADTSAELGLILEAAYDSRGEDALTSFEEDVVYGVRLALNDEFDTEFLAFASTDVESGSTAIRLEAERRLGESFKVELEGQGFLFPDDDEIESDLRRDSYLRLKLSYFW